jgi:CRISPR-associated protein (TIGR02710 family)
MKTAFVATVGMGTGPEADITKPLVESIRQANPDLLLLFATEQTKGNAETILTALDRAADSSRVHILKSSKEDVEQLYKEMLDETRRLFLLGVLPMQVTADFTTGTKPMSAALVLTAARFGFGNLKYIAVRRDEQRRVCPGTERMLTFKPAGLYASAALSHAFEHVVSYRFGIALEMLEALPDDLLSATERNLRDSLRQIAEAYSAWDVFQHIRFPSAHARVKFSADPSLIRFRAPADSITAVDQLARAAAAGVLTDTMVVDLLSNARRRIEEGKYDDATARLYRACELLEQWRLADKHGIDTGNVDLTKVPDKSQGWLQGCLDYKEKKVKIGSERGYRLLADFGDSLGKSCLDDDKLRALLKERNDSILAHGTKPVTVEACRSLLEKVEALAKNEDVIQDYEHKSALLRFPWSP